MDPDLSVKDEKIIKTEPLGIYLKEELSDVEDYDGVGFKTEDNFIELKTEEETDEDQLAIEPINGIEENSHNKKEKSANVENVCKNSNTSNFRQRKKTKCNTATTIHSCNECLYSTTIRKNLKRHKEAKHEGV